MVCRAWDHSLQALVPVDALVEDCSVRIEHIKDGVCVHFLTRRVNANLKVRRCSFQKLAQERALEYANLYHIARVLERGVEVRASIRTIDLVNFDIYCCGCVDQGFVHVEQQQPFAWLQLYSYRFNPWHLIVITTQVSLLQVGHVDEVLHVFEDQVFVLGRRLDCL